MKILLATLSVEPESRFEHSPDCAYSLGLGYICSVLEKEGHEVKILFFNNFSYEWSEKVFFATLEKFQPHVVGLQIFGMNRVLTYRAVERMQHSYPNIRIVIGGIHSSTMYEQILKRYPYLIAVIGEGEYTVLEIIKALESNTSLDDIKGIAFNKNGNVVRTPSRALIDRLDDLPFPRHEAYFENEPNRTVGHVITSRGCPFNCTFCCLKLISKRVVRKRSITKVLEEIIFLKRKYPRLKHVQLHDDTFALDNERVIQFCKMVAKEKLGVTFECSTRVKPISSELFWWMEKAGFTKIMFGLETGSDKLLKSIRKNIAPKDVIDLFNALKPFKFTVTTFLMCGFPGETDATISETIKLVQKTQKIKYSWIAGVGKLLVYPGTDVYQSMKNAGLIDDDFWLSDKPVPFYTVEHPLEKLIEFEDKIMNSVSVERIFTLNGFTDHFMKIPWPITKYLVKYHKHFIRIIKQTIKKHLVRLKLYQLLKMYLQWMNLNGSKIEL